MYPGKMIFLKFTDLLHGAGAKSRNDVDNLFIAKIKHYVYKNKVFFRPMLS